MTTAAAVTELVYQESWRAEVWDDDVPSRPGWQVKCSVHGLLGRPPGWAYEAQHTAQQVRTRHLRRWHPAPKPARARRGRHRTRAMQAAGEYWVVMCAACQHPGGLH